VEFLSPQKRLGPQIANPQIKNPQITKNQQIANPLSAKLAEGPKT
jgi:hypothetical protein